MLNVPQNQIPLSLFPSVKKFRMLPALSFLFSSLLPVTHREPALSFGTCAFRSTFTEFAEKHITELSRLESCLMKVTTRWLKAGAEPGHEAIGAYENAIHCETHLLPGHSHAVFGCSGCPGAGSIVPTLSSHPVDFFRDQ